MKTIYTAIFGPYEPLKEPKVITPGWRYTCYTDQDFKSDVWDIVKVSTPKNPRKKARLIKALFHLFVETEFSIYIDGSFQINCNLDEFWNKHYGGPFSCPSHPERSDVYEEAAQCIKGQRGGIEGLVDQIKSYEGIVPHNNGLITSGILLRQRSRECVLLCLEWLEETTKEGNSLRDQISFARVSMKYKNCIHLFNYKYGQRMEFLFHPHRDVIIDGVNYY